MIFRILMVSLMTFVVARFDGPDGVLIDSILARNYLANDVQPLATCHDLQFLRRASLDLIGRVPTLEEIRSFERNPDRKAPWSD